MSKSGITAAQSAPETQTGVQPKVVTTATLTDAVMLPGGRMEYHLGAGKIPGLQMWYKPLEGLFILLNGKEAIIPYGNIKIMVF